MALAFARDPVLGEPFVQLVGLTADEYEAARQWRVHGMLGVLSRDNPMLVTDLARASVLVGADAEIVASGIADEGSSLAAHVYHAKVLELRDSGIRGVRVICGAAHVQRVSSALTARIARGHMFQIISPDARVVFMPAPDGAARFWWDGNAAHIDVTPGLLRELQGMLRPVRGIVHSFVLKGLSIAIEPSEIRTPDGELVEVVG